MTQPLALLLYEKLLPGTQIAARLQDINWRVQTLNDAHALAAAAEEHKPLLILAHLDASPASVCDSIVGIRRGQSTSHIPIIAFTSDETQHQAAADAGATLVVSDTAILQHLNQFMDQALSEF